jgi:glycosyltransferase involved in cell wall biosynthesis
VAALESFDVHHFHSAEPLVMLASLRVNAARVYTHRGGTTDYGWGKRFRFAIVGRLLNRFGAVSGNTAHAARCAEALFRLPRESVHVTYNGVEVELLAARQPSSVVRASLGLSEEDYVLGTAANLKPWKRIDRLIEAIGRIDDPRLRLLVVGDGIDRARLEAIAHQSSAGGRITFAGAQTEIGDFLGAMDAFALPSTALESFGNAAVEAMAVGLPTVVFADSGGMLEHVRDGETGFVVSNSDELAATLRRLLEAPELGGGVGERARAFIRERYTPSRSEAAYRELYQLALARQS